MDRCICPPYEGDGDPGTNPSCPRHGTVSPGHPKPLRFKTLLKRSAKYAAQGHQYWQGSYAAYRIVAADLGYTHAEVDAWVAENDQEKPPRDILCACGELINTDMPYVEEDPLPTILWHGNAEGGGHKSNVKP